MKHFKDTTNQVYAIEEGFEDLLPAGCVEITKEEADAISNPPPTLEQIIAHYIAHMQERLDAFARTRNYDGILSAATYATSAVPKFKAEGQYAVEARDATWAKCYEILAAVEGGTRPMPTMEELIAELPVLTWPN
jgi:hypothetical protein